MRRERAKVDVALRHFVDGGHAPREDLGDDLFVVRAAVAGLDDVRTCGWTVDPANYAIVGAGGVKTRAGAAARCVAPSCITFANVVVSRPVSLRKPTIVPKQWALLSKPRRIVWK